MDYLTYIVWRAPDGTEWKDYHTLQADGPDEAEAKARALAEAITRSEHFDSGKRRIGRLYITYVTRIP